MLWPNSYNIQPFQAFTNVTKYKYFFQNDQTKVFETLSDHLVEARGVHQACKPAELKKRKFYFQSDTGEHSDITVMGETNSSCSIHCMMHLQHFGNCLARAVTNIPHYIVPIESNNNHIISYNNTHKIFHGPLEKQLLRRLNFNMVKIHFHFFILIFIAKVLQYIFMYL